MIWRWLVVLAIAIELPAAPAAKTAIPDPTPPSVDFELSVTHPSVLRGHQLTAIAIVTNKSAIELDDLVIRSLNDQFAAHSVIARLPAFASGQVSFPVTAGDTSEFGDNRLLFYMEYRWKTGDKEFHSARSGSVSLTVQRQFEEEAKGLPGGSGALLYLLLPIMPAFLAFEFVNTWRKGEGIKMPTFKSEWILPAFFVGLGVSFLILLIAKQKIDFAYTDPRAFAIMLLLSLASGAMGPLALWYRARRDMKLHGFRDSDTGPQYIQKALRLNPQACFPWITGLAERRQWQGFLLKQPDGKAAVGAQIQVSPAGDRLVLAEIKKLFSDQGELLDATKLEEWLQYGLIRIDFQTRIIRGNEALSKYVTREGVEGLKQLKLEDKPLFVVVA